MEFDPNQFLFRKPNYWKISSLVSVVIGGILIFISLFLDPPIYFYTLVIGGLFVIYYFGYKLYEKNKGKVKTIKIKKSKIGKIQKSKKIKGDKEHILCMCPSCNQKIRLPYSKGIHGVVCPKCKHSFKIKN